MDNQLPRDVSQLRRELASHSIKSFAKLYLGHHIKIELSKAHENIYKILFKMLIERAKRLAFVGPRSLGKTTTITLVYVLFCICFKLEAFIVILSSTAKSARKMLEDIKRELVENDKLLADFPELSGSKPRPWTQDEIEVNGVRVAVFGSDQHLRGKKKGQHRPSLIVADDIEVANVNFNPEIKQKQASWYEQVVLELGSEKTNHIMIGNFHNPMCVIGDYVDPEKNRRWIKIVYKAITAWPDRADLWDIWSRYYNGKEKFQELKGPDAALAYFEQNKAAMLQGAEVLWPERWDFYDLRCKYEDNPIQFNAEYQNEPLDPRALYFAPDLYQYWDNQFKTVDEFLLSMPNQLEFYGAWDPAFGNCKDRGDYNAITVVGRHRETGTIYHILSVIERMTHDEAIDTIISLHQRFGFVLFAIESNQAQVVLVREINKRCREKNIGLYIEEVRNCSNKRTRIESLQALMKTGSLVLNRMNPLFNEQLRYYPRAKHDDALDSLEMAVRISGEGGTIQAWSGCPRGRGGDDDYGTDYQCFNLRIDGPI